MNAPVNASFGPTDTAGDDQPHRPKGQVTLRCNAVPLRCSLSMMAAISAARAGWPKAAPTFVAYAVKQPTISGTNYTVCPAFGAGTAWTSASTLNASAAFAASGGNRTVTCLLRNHGRRKYAARDVHRYGRGVGDVLAKAAGDDERAGRSAQRAGTWRCSLSPHRLTAASFGLAPIGVTIAAREQSGSVVVTNTGTDES